MVDPTRVGTKRGWAIGDGDGTEVGCALVPASPSASWTRSRTSYTARALGFSIFTEAETIETPHASVRDAVLCHFEEAERPRVIRLHFVRDQLIAV
jgi:hypothetical protein